MNTKFTTWQKKRIIMARGCLSYTFFLLFFERRINDSRNQLLKNIRSEERRVGKESRTQRTRGQSRRRRHTRSKRDWSSDVCSSDLRRRNWLPGRINFFDLNYHEYEIYNLAEKTYNNGTRMS